LSDVFELVVCARTIFWGFIFVGGFNLTTTGIAKSSSSPA
jgi:hypothetical protein